MTTTTTTLEDAMSRLASTRFAREETSRQGCNIHSLRFSFLFPLPVTGSTDDTSRCHRRRSHHRRLSPPVHLWDPREADASVLRSAQLLSRREQTRSDEARDGKQRRRSTSAFAQSHVHVCLCVTVLYPRQQSPV